MFFFLSKTAGYLTQPLVIVSILFLTGLLLRKPKPKKAFLLTSFLLLILFSNQYLAHNLMRSWEVRPIPFSEVKGVYDYGILLTGVTRGNAGPPDRVYFLRGADRATHTMHLYKLGLIRKLIISGGSGLIIDRGFREADDLASFMILCGVPREDIIIENRSRNTHDSAVEVAALLSKIDGPKRTLLITSGYHLPRAAACFKKAGVQTDLVSTDPIAPGTHTTLDMIIVPKLESIGIWQALFKEWAGMVAYKMAGYI